MAAAMDVEKTTPNTYNELLDPNTKTVIKICKIRRGDDEIYQPKVIAAGTEKEFQIYQRLPAMSTLYSDTSANGDQEKFSKSPEQAANTFTLLPDNKFPKVAVGMPNLAKEQQEAFDKLEQMHKDLLIAAFKAPEVKCSGKVRAKVKALKILKKASVDEIVASFAKRKTQDLRLTSRKKLRRLTRKSTIRQKRLKPLLFTCILRTRTMRV